MRIAEALQPASSDLREVSSCSSCRETMQLQVDFCPFCGQSQAIDEPALTDLLSQVDWSSETPSSEADRPAVAPHPKPDVEAPIERVPIVAGPDVPIPAAGPGRATAPEPLGPEASVSDPAGDPDAGRRRKRRLVAVVAIVLIVAALLARLSPSDPPRKGVAGVAGSSSSSVTPVRLPVPVPASKPRPPAPSNGASPEPSRSSVRLTSQWKTVGLGSGRDRGSIALQSDRAFRLRAGGKLYTVNGSAPVALDLRGFDEIDLRAAAGSVTVDIVTSKNRSLVEN